MSSNDASLSWTQLVRVRLRRPAGAALIAACILQTACLSPTFEVSRDEMERLSRVDPGQRGRAVRAVQRFSVAEDMPPAPPFDANVQGEAPGAVIPPPMGAPAPLYHPYWGGYGWGEPYYMPHYSTVRVGGGSAVGGGMAGSTAGPADKGGGGVASAAAASSKAGRDSIASAAAAAVVLGIAVGVGLAVSEGARHDGWVAVHPHHPVHIVQADGGHRIIALDEVRPGELRADESAVIVGKEGAGLWLRGRAPLDREGFTYQMGGGYTGMQLAREVAPGGLAELAIGMFPSQMLGIVARTQFASGGYSGNDYLGWRVGAEAQLIPLAWGRLHVGGYGGAGLEWMKSGGPDVGEFDDRRLYWSAGGLMEIEWTTRLAFFLRLGASATGGKGDSTWSQAGSFGFSVY